jgi:hypothetical protein
VVFVGECGVAVCGNLGMVGAVTAANRGEEARPSVNLRLLYRGLVEEHIHERANAWRGVIPDRKRGGGGCS